MTKQRFVLKQTLSVKRDNISFGKYSYGRIIINVVVVVFTTFSVKLSQVCIRNQIWRKTRTLDQILYVVWFVYSPVSVFCIFVLQKIILVVQTCNKDPRFGVHGMSHNQLLNLVTKIFIFYQCYISQIAIVVSTLVENLISKNLPSLLPGVRTCDSSITSPALYQYHYQ